jgi:hypothetical protein
MMGPHLERLLAVAGSPLGVVPVVFADMPDELKDLLARSNGFVAFESALHVFPSAAAHDGGVTVESWNARDLWRTGFGRLPDDLLFFAEDIFGGQFAFGPQGVVSFDPETGGVALIADSLEGWAARILEDIELLTGFPLAHSWQQCHGQLPRSQRLLPKRPFVLGGDFAIDNLYPLNAVEGMQIRAELARQIATLPEGAAVTFKVVD